MRHWYLYIVVTLMTCCIAACSDDDADMHLGAESTEVYVSVMLTIGGDEEAARTRATIQAPGDDNPAISLEDGSFQDSYINPDDVELLVFDNDNKFVDKVNILWRTHSGETDNVTAPTEEPYQCLIQGSLDMENLTEGNYHIMALCNQDGVLKSNGYTPSAGTSIDDVIANITFSGYNSTFTKTLLERTDGNYTARIPMWGICTVSLKKGENTTAPIAVLRAMAQVRVRLGDGIKNNYTLNGASLNIANTGGTLAAGNKQAYSYTNNTYTTAWNTDAVTPITSATPFGETTEGEIGVEYYYSDTPLTKDLFKKWNGVGADASSTTDATTPELNTGTNIGSNSMVYGYSTVEYLYYADLTGYDRMVIEGTSGMVLRVLMNREVPVEGGDPHGGDYIEEILEIKDGKAIVDFSELDYVHLNSIKTHGGSPSGQITKITLQTKQEKSVSLGLPFIKSGDDYIIYVPEYQNLNEGNVVTTPASISLNITDSNGNPILDSKGNPYQLHFADYSNGAVPTAPEWDIIRNDIYDYTITDIKENGGLQANVRIMPWDYEKMGYELSQEATVYIWYTSQAPHNYGYGMALPVAYDWGDTENRDKYILKVQVNVPEPKDVKWVAHLTNTVDFELTETFVFNPWYYETYYKYGYGGEEESKLVGIRARNPYDGTIKTTELYFTIETLVEGNATISTGETIKEATNSIPDRIRIVQVE